MLVYSSNDFNKKPGLEQAKPRSPESIQAFHVGTGPLAVQSSSTAFPRYSSRGLDWKEGVAGTQDLCSLELEPPCHGKQLNLLCHSKGPEPPILGPNPAPLYAVTCRLPAFASKEQEQVVNSQRTPLPPHQGMPWINAFTMVPSNILAVFVSIDPMILRSQEPWLHEVVADY